MSYQMDAKYSIFNCYNYNNKSMLISAMDWFATPIRIIGGGRDVEVERQKLGLKPSLTKRITYVALSILLFPLGIISTVSLALKLITFPCIWEKKIIKKIDMRFKNSLNSFEKAVKVQKPDEAIRAINQNPNILTNQNVINQFFAIVKQKITDDVAWNTIKPLLAQLHPTDQSKLVEHALNLQIAKKATLTDLMLRLAALPLASGKTIVAQNGSISNYMTNMIKENITINPLPNQLKNYFSYLPYNSVSTCVNQMAENLHSLEEIASTLTGLPFADKKSLMYMALRSKLEKESKAGLFLTTRSDIVNMIISLDGKNFENQKQMLREIPSECLKIDKVADRSKPVLMAMKMYLTDEIIDCYIFNYESKDADVFQKCTRINMTNEINLLNCSLQLDYICKYEPDQMKVFRAFMQGLSKISDICFKSIKSIPQKVTDEKLISHIETTQNELYRHISQVKLNEMINGNIHQEMLNLINSISQRRTQTILELTNIYYSLTI